MEIGFRTAVYLVGMMILGVVSAFLFVTLRGGQDGTDPTAPPTAAPLPSRAAVASLPPARPSQAPETPSAAASTNQPTALAPDMTPWPAWLTIPEDFWGDPDDQDRDGLTTSDEQVRGTESYQWDTDFGGESDGSEVAAGRDPRDRSDDVPPTSTCIPEGAKGWDASSPAESPPPAPELEALLPAQLAGARMQVTSFRGLARVYGMFNSFWDAVLLCAGGQPEDLSHAIGVRGTLPGFAILAIRIDGADMDRLGRDLMSELESAGRGRRARIPVRIDGRDVTFLLDGDVQGFAFATYVSGDVLFLMTEMSATDAGIFTGGVLDPEHVREMVAALPAP